MSDFQKGDVVVLKSGGPQMTVEKVGQFGGGMGIASYNGVACVWFEGAKVCREAFPVETVEKS